MATSAPPGMEWQSYFNNFTSLSDVLNGTVKPGITSQLLGGAISALAGGNSDFGAKLSGIPAAPQGSIPSPAADPSMAAPAAPMAPAVPGQPPQFAPQVNGQPMMTQPPIGTNIQQQPMTQPQSYSRFLFSPK